MVSSQRVFGARRRLDAQGKLKELILLDDQGKPFVGESGYAKKTLQYDRRGNVIVEQYLDDKDQPIQLTAVGGHHRIEFDYDTMDGLCRKLSVRNGRQTSGVQRRGPTDPKVRCVWQ